MLGSPVVAIWGWQVFPVKGYIQITEFLGLKKLKIVYPQVLIFSWARVVLLMQDPKGRTHAPKYGTNLLLPVLHMTLHSLIPENIIHIPIPYFIDLKICIYFSFMVYLHLILPILRGVTNVKSKESNNKRLCK